MNRWELEQKIVIKALKDPAFKKKLLSQPKEAVREFLTNERVVDFSRFDKINVRVVEEKRDEWVLAMPYLEEGMSSLTDQQLEKAVGGGPGLIGPSGMEGCGGHRD